MGAGFVIFEKNIICIGHSKRGDHERSPLNICGAVDKEKLLFAIG